MVEDHPVVDVLGMAVLLSDRFLLPLSIEAGHQRTPISEFYLRGTSHIDLTLKMNFNNKNNGKPGVDFVKKKSNSLFDSQKNFGL